MTSTDGRKSSAGKAHKPPAAHPWRGKSYDAMERRKKINEQKRNSAQETK